MKFNYFFRACLLSIQPFLFGCWDEDFREMDRKYALKREKEKNDYLLESRKRRPNILPKYQFSNTDQAILPKIAKQVIEKSRKEEAE